ncbi:MAG: hypothetical protein ACOVS5_00765 [Oligoflexus sp.]|jgi:hypothetical protein
MKKVTELRSKSLRRERNSDLIRRMRNGDQLSSFNSYSSWFPPRPIIEKDQNALEKLYGADVVSLNHRSDDGDHHPFRPLRLA